MPRTGAAIEQFRPGVAERLGIGYSQARALKDDIVYRSLPGFEAIGPYKDRPGHDLNFLALAGLVPDGWARSDKSPALSEHRGEILTELGVGRSRMRELARRRVIAPQE